MSPVGALISLTFPLVLLIGPLPPAPGAASMRRHAGSPVEAHQPVLRHVCGFALADQEADTR